MELAHRKAPAEKPSDNTENSPCHIGCIVKRHSQPFVEGHTLVSNFILCRNSNLVVSLTRFGHGRNRRHRLMENFPLALDFQIQWPSFGSAHGFDELAPDINFLSV